MELAMRLFASISIVIGAVECFAGYKLRNVMPVVWGIFIGALIGVVIGDATKSTAFGVMMVLILCVVFVILSYKYRSVSILILAALLTAVAMYVITEKIIISILVGIIVGVFVFLVEKPVIIISTAISGAGIILASAYTMMGMGFNGNKIVTTILWIPIALIGVVVQYITAQKPRTRRLNRHTASFDSEMETGMDYDKRKYPGMQRAYRNYCIKCGSEMLGDKKRCLKCGFNFDD